MIGVIINPHSKRNRGRSGLRKRLERIVGRTGRVVETPSVDAITGALRSFAEEKRTYWVADGGDGALHWMINEAVRYFGAQEASEMAVFVPTGGGTIDFVAQAIGLPRDPMNVLRALVQHVERGETVEEQRVRCIEFTGEQIMYGRERAEFRRIAFGTALAGYGANFFGPYYAGDGAKNAARIAALVGAAFGSAAARFVMRGPLERIKPEAIRRAEHDFLRTVRARLLRDGAELQSKAGDPVREHTVIHLASVPLNLANIFRVFPLADGEKLHLHAGYVTAIEMARLLPRAMASRTFNEILPRGYDGPAQSVHIECLDGDELQPVLDGEVFFRIPVLRAELGVKFRMPKLASQAR